MRTEAFILGIGLDDLTGSLPTQMFYDLLGDVCFDWKWTGMGCFVKSSEFIRVKIIA